MDHSVRGRGAAQQGLLPFRPAAFENHRRRPSIGVFSVVEHADLKVMQPDFEQICSLLRSDRPKVHKHHPQQKPELLQ